MNNESTKWTSGFITHFRHCRTCPSSRMFSGLYNNIHAALSRIGYLEWKAGYLGMDSMERVRGLHTFGLATFFHLRNSTRVPLFVTTWKYNCTENWSLCYCISNNMSSRFQGIRKAWQLLVEQNNRRRPRVSMRCMCSCFRVTMTCVPTRRSSAKYAARRSEST